MNWINRLSQLIIVALIFILISCNQGMNPSAATWIKQIGVEGISYGAHVCGFGNYFYCPENPVTRSEMAGMLVRTFTSP